MNRSYFTNPPALERIDTREICAALLAEIPAALPAGWRMIQPKPGNEVFVVGAVYGGNAVSLSVPEMWLMTLAEHSNVRTIRAVVMWLVDGLKISMEMTQRAQEGT